MIMAPNGLRVCEVAGNLVKSAPPPPNPLPPGADIGTHVTLWVGKYGFEFR